MMASYHTAEKWSFPHFEHLADELKTEVFRNLTATDLINISLTSKSDHVLTIPIIYHNVHIRETLHKNMYWQEILEHRQCQLFRTLKEHPEYYLHIRSLRFFVGAPNIEERIPPNSLLTEENAKLEEEPEDESWPETWIEALHDRERYIWTFLEKCSLAQVNSVDLFFKYGMRPPDQGFPEVLFPKAIELQLRGMMDWALIKSFFHESITTPLSHLGIDTVEHRGFRLCDGGIPHSPLPPDVLENLQSSSTLNRRERSMRIAELKKVERTPGPVPGILPLASHRCSSLTSLFIRKQGKSSPHETPYRAYPDEADIKFLEELSVFLEAMKASLRRLVIIQARIDHGGGIYVGQGVAAGEELVMVERFREMILPVLVGGEWGSLESLTLNGCGLSDNEDAKQQIRGVCPKLVEFSTTEDAPWVRVDSRWFTAG
ncbi:hypothetical protein B0O99DRAFT_339413 [Bisporella sp. PMI_857]|nr:hypothetical protein B0O99DRAFT_339413 [Bisporella sp. PMI_857]